MLLALPSPCTACLNPLDVGKNRGGEWYLEKRGLGKFWQDLEISEAFLISLEVSFLHG